MTRVAASSSIDVDAKPEPSLGRIRIASDAVLGPEEQDDHFRQIAENLPTALSTTDTAGRITVFNEAAVQLWGRRPRIGEDWWCGSWRLYWLDGSPMAHDECPMAITLKTGEPVRGAK